MALSYRCLHCGSTMGKRTDPEAIHKSLLTVSVVA